MLQHAFPAFGTARLGLIARMAEPDLADAVVRLALKGGALERQGRVEMKDAAEEHGLGVVIWVGRVVRWVWDGRDEMAV